MQQEWDRFLNWQNLISKKNVGREKAVKIVIIYREILLR